MKQQSNSTGDEQNIKVPIPVRMAYAEEEESIHLKIRKAKQHDEKDDKEREEMQKVRCFLTNVAWRKELRRMLRYD